MYMKQITSMLLIDQINHIANYIKSGGKIKNVCLMHVVEELKQLDITEDRLRAEGAILTLSDLFAYINKAGLLEANDTRARYELKQYHLVISKVLTLWEKNRLNKRAAIIDELDDLAFKTIMHKWNMSIRGGPSDNCIEYLNKCVSDKANDTILSIQNGELNVYYHSLIVNKILNDWDKNNFDHYNKLKAHLDGLFKDQILLHANQNQLDTKSQEFISKELRNSIIKHIVIYGNYHIFSGLGEALKRVSEMILSKKKIISGYVFTEAVDYVVENKSSLSSEAIQDICTLMRDEIIPKLIDQENDFVDIKKKSIVSLMEDTRGNRINTEFKAYLRLQLYVELFEEIKNDIIYNRHNQIGVMAEIIKDLVGEFKNQNGNICAIMPNCELLFSDIYNKLADISRAVNMTEKVAILENENAKLKEQFSNQKLQIEILLRKVEQLSEVIRHDESSVKTTTLGF